MIPESLQKTLKTKLQIHFSIYILYAIVLFSSIFNQKFDSLVLITTAFITIYLHELAHIFAGHYFGINTEKIILSVIGGMAFLDVKKIKSSKESLLISLAGPTLNITLAAITYLMLMCININFLNIVFTLNLMIGIFNLIPLYPLDGGRILKSALLLLGVSVKQTNFIILYVLRVAGVILLCLCLYNLYIIPAIIFFLQLLFINKNFLEQDNCI